MTLRDLLEPGTGQTMTPYRALRAVGHYLDREKPTPDPWYPPGDGWREHHGGACPVPVGSVVEWIYRYQREARKCSDRLPIPAVDLADGWEHDPTDPSVDIVAYRVVQPPTESRGDADWSRLDQRRQAFAAAEVSDRTRRGDG